MKRVVAIAALLLLLGGCGRHVEWVKPGLTQAEFQRDAYECERDTRMSAGSFGGGIIGIGASRNFAQRCMQSKGYTRQRVGKAAPDEMVMCTYPNTVEVFHQSRSSCARDGGTADR